MRIGIHLGLETEWARLLLKGISRFLTSQEEAVLTPLPMFPDKRQFLQTDISGLILTAPHNLVASLQELPVPVVNLSRHDGIPCTAELWSCFQELSRQALSHLQERGCSRVALIGTADPSSVVCHHKIRSLEQGIHDFGLEFLGSFSEHQSGQWTLLQQLQNLSEWVKGLPSPFGLICMDAQHTIRALHSLKQSHLQVPKDVHLLCVSNDSILLECSHPGISSVNFDHETKGYRSAELLMEMIHTGDSRPRREYIPTKGIIPRESTAFAAPHEPQLQKAIQAMHEWIYEIPRLDDIARQSGMSRSTMARKLKQQTGHTPGELLVQIRLEKALEKLRVGSESLTEITDICGYGLPSQLSREVKSKTGMSPLVYRAHWQSQ